MAKIIVGVNDLATTHPKLAEEWHPTKNGDLSPRDVTKGSGRKVWWLFPYDDPNTGKHFDFEWETAVKERVNGCGCPFLSGRKLFIGFNDLATIQPELAEEWHPTKNGELTSQMVTKSSGRKVWWLGKCGHEWESTINDRFGGNSCPVCRGLNILEGYNDLATINPKLAEEWHPTKNGDMTPKMVASSTNKKFWWLGKCGHEWIATVNNRNSRKYGCPICSNKQILVGYNDLATTHPNLVQEWNYEKNGELTPQMITFGTQKKVWWICEKGHEYQTVATGRIRGEGCPICSNKQILVGYNDLATTHPNLIEDWDYEKNLFGPTEVVRGTATKVYWKCRECNHEWVATVLSRTSGNGCPECAKQKKGITFTKNLIKQNGSFADKYPELLVEWNYDKNDIAPTEVTEATNKSVWWICSKCGCEWKTSIAQRSRSKTGCPDCAKALQTSFPEQAIYYYIKKVFPDAINGDREIISPLELDIYIPSKRTAIEYDGSAWHVNVDKDYKKNNICKKRGISLFRIREEACPKLEDSDVKTYIYNQNKLPELEFVISHLLSDLECENMVVNIEDDRDAIYEQYYQRERENSISVTLPELLKEWNFEKNTIKPSTLSSGSNKKVWWKCGQGHDYRQSIVNKAKGIGCPYCSNKKVLAGYNDIATTNPSLLNEWNYERNIIKPTEVTIYSQKKYGGSVSRDMNGLILSHIDRGEEVAPFVQINVF